MKRCQIFWGLVVCLCLNMSAMAANTEDQRNPNDPLDQGGDVCSTAFPITSLPFCDMGTTSGYNNDYPVQCQPNSNARDVVYTMTPNTTSVLTFSLCGSSFNTALTIWRGCPSQGGVLVCCSDDVCGDDACCSGVTVAPGSTYYIVVDGGLGPNNFGNYVLNVVQGADVCPNTLCDNSCPFESRDYEPSNDTCATTTANITCNDTLCGVISDPGDRDWYRISFTQFPCAILNIGIAGNDAAGHSTFGQGLQPRVSLWNSDCTTMLMQDETGIPGGFDAYIESTCLPAGTYYILVEGVNTSGPYELWEWCAQCACPECPYPSQDIEINDVCSSGGGIVTCGDTLCGFTELARNDYYYLDVFGNGCQNVTIDIFGGSTPGYYPFGQGLDPAIYLYDINCSSLVASDLNSGVGDDPRVTVCLEPGLYRLLVTSEFPAGNSGPYIIATSCEPCECPATCDYENRDNEGINNSCGTNNPQMVCGDTLCGDISAVTDADWYLISVPGPDSMLLKIDVFGDDTPGWYPFGQGLDPMVRVADLGCVNILATDTAGGVGEDAHLEICLAPGIYHIMVQEEDFTTGPYILATSCEPCASCPYPDLDVEPLNNTCGTSNELLHCGDGVCGEIVGAAAPDQDWYMLQVTECTQLFLNVFGDDTPGWYPFGHGLNPAIELWTGDCLTELAVDLNSGAGEDPELVTACLEPGLYFIRVYGENGSQGPYILLIGCEQCECGPPCTLECPTNALHENEPCPSFVDTTDGGCDSRYTEFLPLRCGDIYCGTGYSDPNYTDSDWYHLRIEDAPQQVRLCVASEFDGYLTIFTRGPSLDDPCHPRDIVDCRLIVGCQGTQCLSVCLPVGEYNVSFAPTGLTLVNCWNYILAAACSPCEPVVCEAPDSLVIHYPDSLSGADSLVNVVLYWPPVPGADEYRIYRTSQNNNPVIVTPANYIASTVDTFFIHQNILSFGVEEVYIYQVVAYCRYNHPPCVDSPAAAIKPITPSLVVPKE